MLPNKQSVFFNLIIALTIMSCTLDEGKKVQVEELSLNTTDDSEIFFKNLRQSAYRRQEVDRMVVFKNKKYTESEDSIPFQVKIVWSWFNDKAFILMETEAETDDSVKFHFMNSSIDLFASESFSAADQTVVAATVYNALTDKEVVIISNGTSTDTLFTDSNSREAFRVTMSDYLRLTNNF